MAIQTAAKGITLVQVQTPRDRRRFAGFPWSLYRDDDLWVPPLYRDQIKAIHPLKGDFFRRGGKGVCFMALDSRGRVAGTICAAMDPARNENLRAMGKPSECIFGFLEYRQDPSVLRALIWQARKWALARGLERLVGPFNLDYEDRYGVLVDGWDHPPALLCGHSKPYYREMMENEDFIAYRPDNVAYRVDLDQPNPALDRVMTLAKRVEQGGRISLRGADFSRLDREIDLVYSIINPCLEHLNDYVPFDRQDLADSLKAMKPLADPELILFAQEGPEEKMVGWFPGLPNANETLKTLNGLHRPWDYLRLPALAFTRPRGLSVKSVLVLPEWWARGVSILFFARMRELARKKGYRWIDLSLTSLDNPYTPQLAQRLGATLYKRYRVYARDTSVA